MNLFENNISPKHGGDLTEAANLYDIALDQWLDMSTGISPWHYPVSELDNRVWKNLPPNSESLIKTTPGSQAVIRLLPLLYKKSVVAVPKLGYQEHAFSWQLAGHSILFYQNKHQLFDLIEQQRIDHAVVINPNNPTCECMALDVLEQIANSIKGTLVVDEAFVDGFPVLDSALISETLINLPNLIVLKSIGKFFGLAGLRVGFAITETALVQQLRLLFEPWSISHASMVIAGYALQDKSWQSEQRLRIKKGAEALELVLRQLCRDIDDVRIENAGLFSAVFADADSIRALHTELAKRGVWTRLFNTGDEPAWLRFSLIDDIPQFLDLSRR